MEHAALLYDLVIEGRRFCSAIACRILILGGFTIVNDVKYDVNDMPKPGLLVGLSFQHLFAMFGATVLVPILVGIDPAIALFSSGLGTLAHLTVTKYKIPCLHGV